MADHEGLGDEAWQIGLLGLRDDDFAAYVGVVPRGQAVEVNRHGEYATASHCRVHGKPAPEADCGARQAISVSAKSAAVVLAMSAAPHNCQADHLGNHTVA